jgi:hypothetical protein
MQVATLAAAACTCIAPWGRGAAGQGRRRRPRRSMCAAHGLDGVRGAPDLFINSSTHFCDSGESGDVICEVRGRRRGVKTNTESWRTRPARGGGTRNTESWRTRPARGGGTHTAARGLAKCAGAPLRSHDSAPRRSRRQLRQKVQSRFFFSHNAGPRGWSGSVLDFETAPAGAAVEPHAALCVCGIYALRGGCPQGGARGCSGRPARALVRGWMRRARPARRMLTKFRTRARTHAGTASTALWHFRASRARYVCACACVSACASQCGAARLRAAQAPP